LRRKILALLNVIVLFITFVPLCANAYNTENVRDYLNYLSMEEVSDLQDNMDTFKANYNLDAVIVITNNTNGKSSRDYADDYYDQNGYGIGEDLSGILMLINMDEREVWISTAGKAIRIFTDSRLDSILDNVYEYLANGDFFNACKQFVQDINKYAQMGVPIGQYNYDTDEGRYEIEDMENAKYEPEKKTTYFERVLKQMKTYEVYVLASVVSIVSTIIATVRSKGIVTADQMTYEESGSFNLTDAKDIFLRQDIRTIDLRPESDNGDRKPSGGGPPRSSGSSSGRSSTHKSSSGVSHGGRGRKF